MAVGTKNATTLTTLTTATSSTSVDVSGAKGAIAIGYSIATTTGAHATPAIVDFEGSNDGSIWYTAKRVQMFTVSTTLTGYAYFPDSVQYVRSTIVQLRGSGTTTVNGVAGSVDLA